MKGMRNESDLAGVLAHEVAHVSHKHALQIIRRTKRFELANRVSQATMKGEQGKKFRSMIEDLETTLFDKGLDQNFSKCSRVRPSAISGK